MKQFFLNIIFVMSIFSYTIAHAPILDYEKINAWCDFVTLSKTELTTFAKYLNDGKKLVEQCSLNPQFINSPQGKVLQNKIDQQVQNILKDPHLIQVFQYFVVLVRDELSQNVHEHQKGKVRRNYRLLTMIFSACLDCVHNKLISQTKDCL